MTDKLRDHILNKFGEPVNSSKDCEILSREIVSHTKRSISATTLRRFFGLLPANTSISAYSLDTLSIYIGATDYYSFCAQYKKKNKNLETDFHKIEEELKKLTEYTLKSVSRKSLLPFSKTITRNRLDNEFDSFLNSDKNFFPLIAPGGYGKSIALSHWVQNKKDSNLYLFCPASIFYSLISDKRPLDTHLLFDLRSSADLFTQFQKENQLRGNKLILILDAVDEISSEPEKLFEFADYILDVIHLHRTFVKFIISIRESVWNSHLLSKFQDLESNIWFERTETVLEKGYTNMPLLSNAEIKKILSVNDIKDQQLLLYECIPWDIRDLLRIPINVYFIIELIKNRKGIVQLSQKDLTKEFLKKFVFYSRFSEQKEDIIWKILELMESEEEPRSIPKNELKKNFPVHLKREGEYYRAYNELLQNGILIEEREVNKYGVYTTRIGFRHQNFFYYLLSLYLIKKNEGLDKELLFSLSRKKKNEAQKINLIALLYENAFDNEEFEVIEDLCSLPESILSSWPVRIAVGNSFRRNSSISKKLMRRYAESKKGRVFFFEQFVDTNYMFNNYKVRIEEYLKYESEPEPVLFGRGVLFLAGFLKMNAVECHKHIDIIRSVVPDSNIYPWPLGRKLSSQLLHNCFLENKKDPDLYALIKKHASLAYKYPGYLEKGIMDFEMSVMVALFLIQRFDVLELILEDAFNAYKVFDESKKITGFLRKSQNSIPFCFYEYAKFKQGNPSKNSIPETWETALTNYSATFDDYQYLIIINWFLCDYFTQKGNTQSASAYYSAALELSKFAEYDFFTAYLLFNDPLERAESYSLAEKMISGSDFIMDKFIFQKSAYG